jgi:lipoprotein-anchoring transpeptidase ErfK/SrfK
LNAAQVAAAKQPPSIADAKGKLDAGKVLDARASLYAALSAGNLSESETKSAKQLLNQINAKVVFSPQHFDTDPYGGTITVPPNGRLEKIARTNEVTPDLLMRINGIADARKLKAGQELKIIKGPFNALVSKSAFTLELWLGDPGSKGALYITSFPIGLGKDDSTPTGVWAVSTKLKNPAYYSPRGQGVIAADDPKNPLGEAWIALVGTDGKAVGKTSYGIHGTIDPSSIGKQESMGCIRMRNEDVAQVYEALVDGKSIVVVKE